MKTKLSSRFSAITLALAVFSTAPLVHANVTCESLANPVYGAGGTDDKRLIATVAQALNVASPPVHVVYQTVGTCTAVNAMANTSIITGTASYWDGANEMMCDLPPTSQTIQFAVSSIPLSYCLTTTLSTGIGDFLGPARTYAFIAPKGSTETSISREAAYFVFGFGKQSTVAPWTDLPSIFIRNDVSPTQVAIGLAIGVPPKKLQGNDASTELNLIAKVGTAGLPNAAIGIVTSVGADASRSTVKELAYKHKDQQCGYFPDSTPSAFDKRNVRDGHYWLWNATHYLTPVDAGHAIKFADVGRVIQTITGDTTTPGYDAIIASSGAGLVPRCAMNVWRDDLGDLRKETQATPCGCAFDKAATGTAPTCTACGSDPECAPFPTTPKCRFGFCEAR